ncbi:dynein regulatory complex protein 10-like isoform X2 [Clarias gariepinus]|uniref:dynein regulatory complex protein 10-like isoform X2 n=1 Tax=Clarias gariepinus TaxID=13013 RepID=UPI00234DC45D|nr:dynein regulatory complex protein 10-like isoform X2 [Clarias gariepinus]
MAVHLGGSAAHPGGHTAQAAFGSLNKPMSNKTPTTRRKKLATPEVRCIINVLDECLCKIAVSSILPCELVNPEGVSEELGDTAVESLRVHLRLAQEYCSLQDTDTSEDKSIAQEVQDSLRNFLRHVRPRIAIEPVETALQGAGPILQEDQKAVQALGAGLQEIREVLMEQLMTTPKEEWERRRLGQEAGDRQKRNAQLLHRVEQEVRAATEHRDDVISKKDEEIQNMKDSLHQIERECEEFEEQVHMKAEQQHQSDLKNSEAKRLHLQEEASQLQVQLNRLTAQHREREVALRQAKLEGLMQTYEQEQAELRQLQERFALLEIEHTQIMEERRREQERREEEKRDRRKKTRAAIIIQRFWRQRRAARKKKGKGKKGKKGKGKKK